MAEPTTWLISFGTQEYEPSMELLRHSALLHGGFDNVILYTPKDIKDVVDTYPDVFRQKGYGLWIWKSIIILQTMQRMREGDYVMYADATMMFEDNITEHLDRLTSDIGMFRLGQAVEKNYRNKYWTQRATFEIMECNSEEYHNAYQVNAAMQVYRKSPVSEAFVREYMRYCVDLNCVNDVVGGEEVEGFQKHRHDQSILTNLYVKHATHIQLFSDISQFGKDDPHPEQVILTNKTLVDHHRNLYGRILKTMVITPTLGGDFLKRCIDSVQKQNLPCVEHMIVVDDPSQSVSVNALVEQYKYKKPIHVVHLPYNTGEGWWNGHRIYASFPALCNSDYVAYLDDDNWYDENHLGDMMQVVVSQSLEWCFSLRKIVNRMDGQFICNDTCESLGDVYVSAVGDFFIDTSAYLLKRELAVTLGPYWFAPGETDRVVCKQLLTEHRTHGTSFKHSLNYAVERNRDRSVSPDFFLQNNKKYPYDFEKKKNIYVFHFMSEKTKQMIECLHDTSRSFALDEWQMTLFRDVSQTYNILNGYAVEGAIPPGSTIFVSMCLPETFPMSTLKRKDIRKIGFTLESPNIRHQSQWDENFLRTHFDHILTYWKPLLERLKSTATFCPHNTHHLDFTNAKDISLLKSTTLRPKMICMILERRDLRGVYTINNTQLECLDMLREEYILDLKVPTTVYGRGWEKYNDHPNIRVGSSGGKLHDPRPSVEIMKEFTFTLIFENCDAEGYVSEKLYDAFVAGSIPIYYGNNNSDVGIPLDMYIDLKKFTSSTQLSDFLTSMTMEDIKGYQDRIERGREVVLKKVGTKAFSEILHKVMSSMAK